MELDELINVLKVLILPVALAWLTLKGVKYKSDNDKKAIHDAVQKDTFEQSLKLRQELTERLEKIEQRHADDVDRYRRRIEEVEDEKRKLTHELDTIRLDFDFKLKEIKLQLSMVEGFYTESPFPQWVKSRDGIMLSLNRAYEVGIVKPWGKSPMDYIGHTDLDFWGEDNLETVEQFSNNEAPVIETGEPFFGVELVPTPEGKKVSMMVLISQHPAGTKGTAIPTDPEVMINLIKLLNKKAR